MDNYLTAATARSNSLEAQSFEGEYKRKETKEVLSVIGLASKKGEFSVTVYTTDTIIVKRLEHLGYKVTTHYDQRDGDYTKVEW